MNTRFLTPVSQADWAHAPVSEAASPRRIVAAAVSRARLPLALTAGLLAGLAVWAALLPVKLASSVAGDPDAVPLTWARSADRLPRLAWKAPILASLPETQERWSRTGPAGEETEDRLMLGDVAGSGAFALVFATRASARPTDSSFYLAAVRSAAKLGLVAGKVPQPAAHDGRFGPTQTALVSLTPVARGVAPRENCLAWRAEPGQPGLSLAGFVCLPGTQRADAAALECLLAGLSSADGAIRRMPDAPACREPASPPIASRTRVVVARARQ